MKSIATQVLQSKAMTKVKSQNTKKFKEYNVMTEKMTVIRVVRDAQTRRRVAECTNGKQKVMAVVPKILSAVPDDIVWVFYDKNMTYFGYHAVIVMHD